MRKDTVLFAGVYEDREEMIVEARQYIEREGYTKDQVRIADRDGIIVVVAK